MLLLYLGLISGILLHSCVAVAPIPVTVYPADSFVDSVCVNTHFTYPTYNSNATFFWNLLKQTGIRTIRDGPAIVPLTQQHGIHIVVGVSPTPTLVRADLEAYYSTIRQQVLDGALVAAFEGPNEPNGFWPKDGYTYNGLAYPDGVLPMLQDMWSIVKGDSVLKQFPIWGPAYSQGSANTYPANAFEPYVDYGNLHPYPTFNCYNQITPYAGLTNYFCQTNDPINTIADDYTNPYVWTKMAPVFGNHKFAFSETGYSTTSSGASYTSHGKYIPRIYMENYRLGIWKTCIYELYDQGADRAETEQNYGMLYNNHTPKPAFLVVRDLIALLSDPGSAFNPANISISIDVTPVGAYTRTNFVHHLLFQKRTGEYFLALWHEIGLENVAVTPFLDLAHPDLPTSITFPGNTIAKAVVHSWSDAGIGSQQSATIQSGNQIVTAAQPQIRIIQFTLNGPTTKPTPAPTSKPTPLPTQKPTLLPTPKPTPKATPAPTEVHVLGLQGYYHTGNALANLTASRLDLTVNFNFGTVSPGFGIPSTYYSARWVGKVVPKCSGLYTFYVNSDDGNRLYVNGALLVNSWVPQALIEKSGTITLTANQAYAIELQYFQNAGGAEVFLSWSEGTCQAKQVIPTTSLYAVGDGLFASYYLGSSFNTFFANRIDATVDFNFGTGAPTGMTGMPTDSFSIKWVGKILPRCTGVYTFYLDSDDGSRLYVNGQLVVDSWSAHALLEKSGTISLTAGQLYSIEVQYFENGGGSEGHLSWSAGSCEPKAIVPQSQLFSSVV